MSEQNKPLDGVDGVHETVIKYGLFIRSAPGYKVFIGAMYNGRVQWVPIDPNEVDEATAALLDAGRYAESPFEEAAREVLD